MVMIHNLAIDLDAFVLTEPPRDGIHIKHDLYGMGWGCLASLDVDYHALFAAPRYQVGFASKGREFPPEMKLILVLGKHRESLILPLLTYRVEQGSVFELPAC